MKNGVDGGNTICVSYYAVFLYPKIKRKFLNSNYEEKSYLNWMINIRI